MTCFKTTYEASEFKGRIKLTGNNSFSCACVKTGATLQVT